MRPFGNGGWRRWLMTIVAAAGLSLAGTASAAPAWAAAPTITGLVQDASGAPQANVAISVIDPDTASTVASTTSAADGSFSVPVGSGTYNVELIPPSNSGFQSFLATGVSTDSAPLTIILKAATVVQLQGMLSDAAGNLYTSVQPQNELSFSSPLNPANVINPTSTGGYSTALFADQNVTVSADVSTSGNGTLMIFTNLPVGTLDHSQTYNVVLPTAELTVSVRDASGNPIAGGGTLKFDGSNISPLPGMPGASAEDSSSFGAAKLDANGNLTVPVPDGITLKNPRIVLSSGLTVPFSAPTMNGDQSVTVTVPPSIQLQGMLSDAAGNLYTSVQPQNELSFSSPLNPANVINPTSTGGYSTALFADQNVTVSADVSTSGNGTLMIFTNLPVGTLDHSQTYNVVLPTAELTVSVRDASGNPIAGGGTLKFDGSNISPLPGMPGASAEDSSSFGAAKLDANGNLTVPVPDGITLKNPRIVLSSGLTVPFSAPTMNGDQSVTVTVPPSIQLQGMLSDAAGNLYTSVQPQNELSFSSPLNPANVINPTSTGGYSTALFADQNVTVSADVSTSGNGTLMIFTNLPVGTLDHSQTYNVVLPTAELTVSVRDASGNPIAGGGTLKFDGSNISPLPGMPGASAEDSSSFGAAKLDANGNLTVPVPDGITLKNPRIVLSSGLTIAFTLHPITGDRHAFIIFDATTGTVLVDDQPPVVTGSPEQAPNASGWYNSPVTISWTSVDPAPSSGTATMPAPTTLSTEGAHQTVTSGKSCDPAGNCATGSVTGLNLDMTPPSVSVTGVTDGNSYTGGVTPNPGCSTSDSLSGVAANATLTVTNSGINYTAICGGATDNAGNQAPPVSVSYQVIPVGWTTASLNDSNGNPISGASVQFRSASGNVTTATTGSDGTAGIALTPGSYSVAMFHATGYQTKTISVTANGPNAVSFATVAVTAQINDPDGADLTSAAVAQAGNTGIYGPKTAVDNNGDVTFQVLPGTSTFAAYDSNGYQTRTVTVTGTATVSFSTVAVTVTVEKNGSPLTTATVAHAGNTGTYGPKTAVDNNGDVTFQVLPGTNTFAAWDGTASNTQTLTIGTTTTNTTITVP